MSEIKASLEAEERETIRERKLNMPVVVLLMIAINIYTHCFCQPKRDPHAGRKGDHLA
jgi:hypothetical protein